jgi:hypothetical protein
MKFIEEPPRNFRGWVYKQIKLETEEKKETVEKIEGKQLSLLD